MKIKAFLSGAWGLPVVCLLLLENIISCKGIDFNRGATGVAFSAYVHSNVPPDIVSDWTTYTLHDVKTMMKVISGRFSKIATFGMGAGADMNPYTNNHTYYKSYSQVFSGEAAALVNKEMSPEMAKQKALSVYVGMWLFSHEGQLDMEGQLALESAEKANTIFEGTVKGIVLSHNDLSHNETHIVAALEELHRLKNDATILGLKLGTRQNCDGFEAQNIEDPSATMVYRVNIFKMSDFVICDVEPQLSKGPVAAFADVKSKLLAYRKNLSIINPQIEVMGQTGWPGNAARTADVAAQEQYWKLVDAWAVQEDFTVWMLEAFDNPWKKWSETDGHYGWWKLTQDSKTGVEQGYLEKAGQGPKGTTTTTHKPTSPTPQPTKRPAGTPDPRAPNANGKKGSGAVRPGNEVGNIVVVAVVLTSLAVIL